MLIIFKTMKVHDGCVIYWIKNIHVDVTHLLFLDLMSNSCFDIAEPITKPGNSSSYDNSQTKLTRTLYLFILSCYSFIYAFPLIQQPRSTTASSPQVCAPLSGYTYYCTEKRDTAGLGNVTLQILWYYYLPVPCSNRLHRVVTSSEPYRVIQKLVFVVPKGYALINVHPQHG